MKRTNLREKGITLIALVVTIIILLILAGVTISLVVGQNGLIGRTQASATTTQMARIIEDGNMAIAAIQTDKLPKGDFNLTLDEVVAEMNNHYGYDGKIAPIDASGVITSITAVKPEIDDLAVGETGTITITPTTGGSAYYIEIYGLYYMLTLNNGKLEISQNGNKLEDLTGGGEYNLTATSNNSDYVTVTETNPTTRTVTLKGIASTKDLQTKPQITISYGKAGGQQVSTTVTVNVLGKYTVTVVAGENGTVSPSGEQQVTEGQSITVTATGNTGDTNYKFASWSDGTTTYTTSNTWEYTPIGNVTLTASFDENEPTGSIAPANTQYIEHFGKTVNWKDMPESERERWRLFYVDSNNKAYLKKDSGSDGYANYTKLPGYGSKISKLGKQLNPNYKGWNEKKDVNQYNANERGGAALLNTAQWDSYASIVPEAEWAIGAPTLEMFIASYNVTHTTQLDTNYQLGWTGYKLRKNGEGDFYSLSDIFEGTDADEKMYFKGHYFIASPSAESEYYVMRIYHRKAIYTIGYQDEQQIAPIVSVPLEAFERGIFTIGTFWLPGKQTKEVNFWELDTDGNMDGVGPLKKSEF